MKPCIIVFDEIDSLVPKRGSNQAGVTDRIVNQFLTELDGTEDRSGIFIIGTTSRPDLIDKAILRPGRIDQLIDLKYPQFDEIKQVKYYFHSFFLIFCQFLLSKGLNSRKLKPLINFLANDLKVEVSWADLVAIDWERSINPFSELIQSLSMKNKIPSNNISHIKSIREKLSLA